MRVQKATVLNCEDSVRLPFSMQGRCDLSFSRMERIQSELSIVHNMHQREADDGAEGHEQG